MASHAPFTARMCTLKDLDLTRVLKADDGHVLGAPVSGTKVVMTVGPACQSPEALQELLDSGAVAARLDLTWGPLDFHKQSLRNLQAAMQKSKKLCATIVDTLGRELMIRRQIKVDENGWPLHEEKYEIQSGQQVVLTTRLDAVPSSTCFPITYDRFVEMAVAGDIVYVGRYLVCGADSASLYLEVVEVNGHDVVCVAQNDAVLEGLLTVFHLERSTNTLLNRQNALPLLSEYDKEAIQNLAAEYEIDYLSLSYTRCEEDIHEARAWLSSIGCSGTRLLAKIETRQSLLNFEGILNAADGIIISRGNLGLDCAPEKMAMVQKTLIQACNLAGKPVLITRVVDTMVEWPRPTRAEATDVANAVLDGVDGILLGAETLRGKFPGIAVRTVNNICRSAERNFDFESHYEFLMTNALEDEEERRYLAEMSGSAVELDVWGSVKGMPAAPLHPMGHHIASSPSLAIESSIMTGLLSASPSVSKTDITLEAARPKYLPKPVKPKTGMSKVATLDTMSNLQQPVKHSSSGSLVSGLIGRGVRQGPWRSPYLSKLESIASSAVRVADKVCASLMICYTHSGATAALVAKYRPAMPIMTLVVPSLVSNGLTWQLQGRVFARQCLLVRGLMPVLANPSAVGEEGLNEAIEYAASLGLVQPHSHVVVVQRTHEDSCIKVLTVDEDGVGVKHLARLTELYRAQTLQQAKAKSAPLARTATLARTSTMAPPSPAPPLSHSNPNTNKRREV